MKAEELVPCHECGRTVAFTEDKQGRPDGLMHEPLTGKLGPHGETGCKAFDDLDGSVDGFIAYLRKCAAKQRNN